MIRLAALCLLAIALTACASDPASNSTDGEWTGGVYLFDAGEEFEYLEVPGSRANVVVIRSDVEKDYSMKQLVQDDDCWFEPVRPSTRTGPERFIQLHEEEVWWTLGRVGAEGEVYLKYDETDIPDAEDESYMFIIHQFGEEDGKLEVAIESQEMRGYFLTRQGNILAGNGVTLKPYDSPEKAPRMLIHQLSSFDLEAD